MPVLRRHADAALAAAFTVASLVQALLVPIAPRGVGVVIALLSMVPLAWRRRRPMEAVIAGSAAWLIPADGYLYLGYAAEFLLFYSVAAHVAHRRRVAGTVAFGLVAGIVGTAEQGGAFGELFGGLSIVVAPAFVGLVVRHTRDQARRLRELTWHLERERERSALAAVAEERTRIAREMHDVVAHGLSVVAIQADAAEAALARDPERAREPLRTIRSATAEALGEMRRLLGVLRAEGEPAELVPQPGLAQLPALLERARAAGVPAELEVVGTPRALPGGLDLSAYRIVQEALTNVGRHAPGAPAQVRLVWDPAALHVEVRDPGSGKPAAAPNGSGHGLVGLRERARLHGGSFAAGPAPGGGFAVTAVLPVEDA